MARTIIHIHLCYIVTPQEYFRENLEVPVGITLADALTRSSLLARYPHLELAKTSIGIFGKPMPLDTVLQAGDRIELYHPLLVDPKQQRRARVKK